MPRIRFRSRVLVSTAVGFVLAAGAAVGVTSAPAAADATTDLTTLVNPFIGTQNFGNTFPGASAPFGMVQVSPDTGGQGGYDYTASKVYGFSQTHLSGVGCGVMGELPIMPTTGDVTTSDYNSYSSAFSHSAETATPGYYRVGLQRYNINAELTATDRTGWQRYTFPADTAQNVLFNTGKANMGVKDSSITVVGDRTLEGMVHDGGFCAGHDQHTVYFSAQFGKPFASYGTWTGATLTPGSRSVADGSGNRGAWVSFDPSSGNQVTLKVGLSYTGIAGAEQNLRSETGDSFDFDATSQALHDRWQSELAKATVSGGTQDRRVAYYTALYHALLHPNLAGDVDGSYMGFDGKVHQAVGYTPRQNFSLWDTYRTQNQFLELLAPQVARDDALSLLAIGREGGWLPRWALADSETNIMTGDPVTATLVELWSKGFLAGHEDEAYQLLREDATQLPPANSQYNGRAGVTYYDKLGYVPYGLKRGRDCPDHGGDNDCDHPASATLEYAASDAALSTMAAALGHDTDATMFAQRGRWYRNLWDQRIHQFRPRMSDGTFLAPYDPVSGNGAFHESGAYQYAWLVPQDPAGLVDLMGGPSATAHRLDDFFAYDHLLTDPAGTARNDWVNSAYDYYAKPTYNPNNEPDLLAPYMYLWTEQPYKTATVIRAAYTLFTTGADGMTGNDDLGEMSAWYVMSSLGVYPTMSGSNAFVLSTPQFPSATVTIGAYGSSQGGTLQISAPGVSDSARYIATAAIDGHSTTRSWLPWSTISHGGSLSYTVSNTPGAWGTRTTDKPPSLDPHGTDGRISLSAEASSATAPTGSSSVVLTGSSVGQWPGTRQFTQQVTVPAGWTASPASTTRTITSNGLPIGSDIPVTVHPPANTPAGTYPVTFTFSSTGLPTIVRNSTVSLVDASCASTTGGTCALGLSYDLDGTATTSAPNSGNFDSSGWSFDAALLPAQGPWTNDGVTYQVPDPAGTSKNFVTTTGQQLAIPAGKYATAHVLGAAHGGDVVSSATITYTDGTTSEVQFALTDWAGSARNGNTVAIAMDHRIKQNQGTDGPPVNIFREDLPLDPNKTVQSIAFPNNSNAEIYAITLTP